MLAGLACMICTLADCADPPVKTVNRTVAELCRLGPLVVAGRRAEVPLETALERRVLRMLENPPLPCGRGKESKDGLSVIHLGTVLRSCPSGLIRESEAGDSR
jgi:hypothetical protein